MRRGSGLCSHFALGSVLILLCIYVYVAVASYAYMYVAVASYAYMYMLQLLAMHTCICCSC